MKIHQVTFSKKNPNVLHFNTVSCFQCETNCVHYMETKMNYSRVSKTKAKIGEPSTSTIVVEPSKSTVVVEPSTSSAVVLDDWVAVGFKMLGSKNEKKWIGKIIRVNENDTFLVSFLRSKRTKLHPGFIYSNSQVPDEYNIYNRYTDFMQSSGTRYVSTCFKI